MHNFTEKVFLVRPGLTPGDEAVLLDTREDRINRGVCTLSDSTNQRLTRDSAYWCLTASTWGRPCLVDSDTASGTLS